eukprot:jgi/Galph1/288/GphlegSOOS_G5093.1
MLNSQAAAVEFGQGKVGNCSNDSKQVSSEDFPHLQTTNNVVQRNERPKLSSIESNKWDSDGLRTPFSFSSSGTDDSAGECTNDSNLGYGSSLSSDLDVARFRTWIEGETYVDLKKLREAAVLGVPSEVRGEVWKFLLSVSKPDRSEELTTKRQMSLEYNELRVKATQDDELIRRVRNEVKRRTSRSLFRNSPSHKLSDETLQTVFSNVIGAFLSAEESFEYDSVLVSLLAPFVSVFETNEVDCFYCFQALMRKHEVVRSSKFHNSTVANFMMLFRTLQSELCEFFESEELEPSDWVPGWIRNLLARELPMDCVLRLWDTYFAAEEGLGLHCYVCLAVIDMLQEELMELDGLELKGYLQNLPTVDMDQVITRAYNIKEDVVGLGLI